MFKLGGVKEVAALQAEGIPASLPPPETAKQAVIDKGFVLYSKNCLVCHGYFAESTGEVPDLRLVPTDIWSQYDAIVRGGALSGGGMASFKDVLSQDDVAAIRAYVLHQAHIAWEAHHKSPMSAHGKPPGLQKP